ncbi:hypothetical protein ACJX0J_040913, partial [Zea mays]
SGRQIFEKVLIFFSLNSKLSDDATGSLQAMGFKAVKILTTFPQISKMRLLNMDEMDLHFAFSDHSKILVACAYKDPVKIKRPASTVSVPRGTHAETLQIAPLFMIAGGLAVPIYSF